MLLAAFIPNRTQERNVKFGYPPTDLLDVRLWIDSADRLAKLCKVWSYINCKRSQVCDSQYEVLISKYKLQIVSRNKLTTNVESA